MNKIPGWPFLISRNRTLDYTVVVAPVFLIQAGQAYLLRDWIRSQSNQKIYINKIDHPEFGVLSIVFRRVNATDEAGNLKKDEVGRPISWIDGLVFQEDLDGYGIDEELFKEGYPTLYKAYQLFWDSDEYSQPASSSPIDVSLPPGQFLHKVIYPDKQKSDWSATKEKQSKQRQKLHRDRDAAQKKIRLGSLYAAIGALIVLAFIGLLIFILVMPLAFFSSLYLLPLLLGFYFLSIGISMVVKNQHLTKNIDYQLKHI